MRRALLALGLLFSASSAMADAALPPFPAGQAGVSLLQGGQPPIYVGNYGAKCDGRSITNVSISSGTASVSSTSYSFAASDAGKLITIPAAGASASLPLNATIQSVSAGVATLSTNAGTSVSAGSATFGTPDAASLQASIAAASAQGGGQVILPLGMCIVQTSLSIANQVSIKGLGAGKSVLKWVSTSDQSQGVIQGYQTTGTCNATVAANYTDIQLTDFEIDGSSATLSGGYTASAKGINMPCTTRSVVDNVYVHDTPATCIATDFGLPTRITNNVAANCGRLAGTNPGGNGIGEGVLGLSNERYVINNNSVINPTHYGIYLEGQSSSATLFAAGEIVGNVVNAGSSSANSVGGPSAGIGASGVIGTTIAGNRVVGLASQNVWNCIANDTGTLGTTPAGRDTVISGNSVENCSRGINLLFSTAPTPSGQPVNLIVTGNRVAGTILSGIEVNGNSSAAVGGIKITGNTVYGGGTSGILLNTGTAGFKNVTITDNTLINNGVTTASDWAKAGVAINTNVVGLTFENNVAYDTAGTQKYGFSINTGASVTGAFVTGNNLAGVSTLAVNVLGTIAYVPVPNLTGVSAPATPAVSGAGTTQATATLLTADDNEVTTCASGAGVLLRPWPGVAGQVSAQEVFIAPGVAAACLAYPPSGAHIEFNTTVGATNAAVSLAIGAHARFVCSSATLCRQAP